ncbi:hypothetical protein [Bauldia litoralis]|uniref:Uncharacterized protein n=1 Tax=Bauldia litoralis TaxID=665467 RepID=A0A1G6EBW6_9HYPH|nr:hypothetical protein [Bauldia litoralis]SDB54903.1 hypothetical protein SAMN02982931_04347 [Bauldia litoralis]
MEKPGELYAIDLAEALLFQELPIEVQIPQARHPDTRGAFLRGQDIRGLVELSVGEKTEDVRGRIS